MKIVQILPAMGWHAGFAEDKLLRLAFWALTDDGQVGGMVPQTKGSLTYAHKLPGFSGYNYRTKEEQRQLREGPKKTPGQRRSITPEMLNSAFYEVSDLSRAAIASHICKNHKVGNSTVYKAISSKGYLSHLLETKVQGLLRLKRFEC